MVLSCQTGNRDCLGYINSLLQRPEWTSRIAAMTSDVLDIDLVTENACHNHRAWRAPGESVQNACIGAADTSGCPEICRVQRFFRART